jgi:outer membrane biosynthesis protein TonB
VEESKTTDTSVLNSQLDQSQANLDSLELQLRAIDAEFEQHEIERRQIAVLSEVCRGLDELRELGADGSFWSAANIEISGEEHLLVVRRNILAFGERFAEIESRRSAVLSKIADEQNNSDEIVDDLYEVKLEEEEYKREWLIERELDPGFAHETSMPWARGGEEDQRFRKAMMVSLLLSLFLGVVLPLINIPLPDPWTQDEIPERLTRLVREATPPPPPPPKEVELKPTETKSTTSDETQVADIKTPEPAARPEPKVAKIKKPESTGILAFREKFSGLAANKATAKLGAQAKIQNAEPKPGHGAVRSMVATRAAGTSGGINLAAVSRDIGGAGGSLKGVEVGMATSGIGEIVGDARPLSGGAGPARTDEEIQIVFDRHKSALYRLYNRELRRDPTLKGQIVLKIQIEPDGSVSLCEVESTDMNAPTLAQQVVSRVGKFDFGAKDGVPPVLIVYPIDFLPAS